MRAFSFIFLIINGLFVSYSSSESITINNVEINYTKRNGETDFKVKFPLRSFSGSDSYWGALGFNTASRMNDAGVVVCIHSANENKIHHYVNREYSASPIDSANPTVGIKNSKIVIEKDFMVCSFTRENSNKHPNYFNFRNKVYFLVAFYRGPVVAYHADNKGISPKPLIFESQPRIIPKVNENTEEESQTITQGAFHLTWKNRANNVTDFVLYTHFYSETQFENIWSAVVFSQERLMGFIDINLCKYVNESSNLTAVNHHFFSQNRPQRILKQDVIGYVNSSVSFKSGILTCTFSRINKVKGNDKYFDLNRPNKYEIKFGKGLIVNNKINFNEPMEHAGTNQSIAFWRDESRVAPISVPALLESASTSLNSSTVIYAE